MCVLWGAFLPLFMWVSVSDFTCVSVCLCVREGGVSAFVLRCCVFLFVVAAVSGCIGKVSSDWDVFR